MTFQGWKIKFWISRFSTTLGNPGAVPTQKRYFPSARFWRIKLTLHILVAGTALNVLNKLALTPGGGSNTNTRDALSKLTGTYCHKDSIKFNWMVLKNVPFCFIPVWFISCLPKRTFVSPLTQKSIHLTISKVAKHEWSSLKSVHFTSDWYTGLWFIKTGVGVCTLWQALQITCVQLLWHRLL